MDFQSSTNVESHFNIHWDDFNRVVIDSLWTLFTEESLTDCTLVISPQEQVQVHRMVLSANSPYFRSLLHAHSHHPNPIIILHDVSYTTLKMLVTFMYRGQVSVTSAEMTTLLKAAEHLQILGLSQTRKSPVEFLSAIADTPPHPGPSGGGGASSSSGSTTTPTAQPPPATPTAEPQQIYSKKARILDQSKTVSSTPSSSGTMSMSGISTMTPLTSSFREREYETGTEHIAEQRSPLSLKKEDESEAIAWKEERGGGEEHLERDQDDQSTLCLRYCCPYCSTNFPSQSSLSRHIMILHPTVYSALYEPSPSTSSQSTAATATETLPHPQPVTSPIDHNHLDRDRMELEMEEAAGASGDGSSGILCKFCGKPFTEVTQLIQHLPIHTGERPFKCPFCDKAFKLRHHMKDHARVHTGERPFRCQLCNKTFSRSTILKAHEKTHFPKGAGP